MVTAKTVFRGWPIGVLAALGLGAMVMGGCAGAVPEASKAEVLDASLEESLSRWHVSSYEEIQTQLIAQSKPLKTIQTQLGLRNVYAPEQDPVVKAKFNSFARKADYCVEYKEDDDCKYLIEARDLQLKSYLRAGCSSVRISSCAPYGLRCGNHKHGENACKVRLLGYQLRSKSPKSFTSEENNRFGAYLHPQTIDAAICPLNGQTHLSTLSAYLDEDNGKPLEEQLNYFFKIQCDK
jgi:hypothetical protein